MRLFKSWMMSGSASTVAPAGTSASGDTRYLTTTVTSIFTVTSASGDTRYLTTTVTSIFTMSSASGDTRYLLGISSRPSPPPLRVVNEGIVAIHVTLTCRREVRAMIAHSATHRSGREHTISELVTSGSLSQSSQTDVDSFVYSDLPGKIDQMRLAFSPRDYRSPRIQLMYTYVGDSDDSCCSDTMRLLVSLLLLLAVSSVFSSYILMGGNGEINCDGQTCPKNTSCFVRSNQEGSVMQKEISCIDSNGKIILLHISNESFSGIVSNCVTVTNAINNATTMTPNCNGNQRNQVYSLINAVNSTRCEMKNYVVNGTMTAKEQSCKPLTPDEVDKLKQLEKEAKEQQKEMFRQAKQQQKKAEKLAQRMFEQAERQQEQADKLAQRMFEQAERQQEQAEELRERLMWQADNLRNQMTQQGNVLADRLQQQAAQMRREMLSDFY
uniref:Uncharacterized protein n=1 Tax=Timema monikensis TaxID=170555 RepID=A0A7R9ED91_9NEOP|nr:unnamed protein product [Timema monikensis]